MLSFVSLVVMVIDMEVLNKTVHEFTQLKSFLDEEPYLQCYRPQSLMRIVFQSYSIYAAAVCFLLTATLA